MTKVTPCVQVQMKNMFLLHNSLKNMLKLYLLSVVSYNLQTVLITVESFFLGQDGESNGAIYY